MEMPALVIFGSQQVPELIHHPRSGMSWAVVAVVEDWATPSLYDALATPDETRRFRVRVSGPLPGGPSDGGQFEMLVRQYGDRPGWWISPAG